MIDQVECVVKGKVQGVMYRDYTRRRARFHNLVGMVENVPNGTVYVLAQGDEFGIKKFLEDLRKGSIFSSVESIDVSWSKSEKTFEDFRIHYRNFADWF